MSCKVVFQWDGSMGGIYQCNLTQSLVFLALLEGLDLQCLGGQ